MLLAYVPEVSSEAHPTLARPWSVMSWQNWDSSVVLPKPAGAEMSVRRWLRRNPSFKRSIKRWRATRFGRGDGAYSFVSRCGAIMPLSTGLNSPPIVPYRLDQASGGCTRFTDSSGSARSRSLASRP